MSHFSIEQNQVPLVLFYYYVVWGATLHTCIKLVVTTKP
jgi:hypothetical protein